MNDEYLENICKFCGSEIKDIVFILKIKNLSGKTYFKLRSCYECAKKFKIVKKVLSTAKASDIIGDTNINEDLGLPINDLDAIEYFLFGTFDTTENVERSKKLNDFDKVEFESQDKSEDHSEPVIKIQQLLTVVINDGRTEKSKGNLF
jgi:hypothetical protein